MARGLNSVTLLGTVSKHQEKDGRQRCLVTTTLTYTGAESANKEHTSTNYVTVPVGMIPLQDGDTVYVEGYFKTRNWDDKDGNKKYITEIVASQLFLVGSDTHINRVVLMGRLGREPEMRYTAEGRAITNIRIASGSKYTDRDGNEVDTTEWHRITLWGKAAENANRYLDKGKQVLVIGRVDTREFVSDGVKGNSTDISAIDIQYLDSGTSNTNPASVASVAPVTAQRASRMPAWSTSRVEEPLFDDGNDLPF